MRASPVKRAFPGATSRARLLRVVVASTVGLSVATFGAPCFWSVARANNGIPGSLRRPPAARQAAGDRARHELRPHPLGRRRRRRWIWTCEQLATSMANALRRRSAADRSLLRALAADGALPFRTTNRAAGTAPDGALAGQTVSDFFTDPSDPMRVLAAATPVTDGGGAALASVFASTDGGTTFGATPLYTAPAGASIVGIEIARSDPQVIYLTYVTVTGTGYDPFLVRSADGGAELDADRSARAAARLQHRPDPRRRSAPTPISLYLRISATTSESAGGDPRRREDVRDAPDHRQRSAERLRAARQRHGPGGRARQPGRRRGRHDGRRLPLDRRRR